MSGQAEVQYVHASGDEGGDRHLERSLGLFDSVMLVAGSMIGSGIYIVSGEMARQVGSAGWLIAAWLIAGALTVIAALSYGELAAMMPRAGGQYVYLRETYSPLLGFLYGWTLFLVIQTGTIAASAIGFSRYLGVLWPYLAETRYLVEPIDLTPGYAISLSTTQLMALLVIGFLSWTNSRGLNYGKIIQNVFTTTKLASLVVVIGAGVLAWKAAAVKANFGSAWTPRNTEQLAAGLHVTTGFGIFVALCVAQVGSLFAADAWNNVTFTAREIRNPTRNVPLSLALGAFFVIGLYICVNISYLLVLPFGELQHAPADRVAAAMLQAISPASGPAFIAAVIMIAAFGCMNGMILSGARAAFAMARDGLFFGRAARLNRANVPGAAIGMQGLWTGVLVLLRTHDRTTGMYGNLYSNLLDYVVSAALLFYLFTIFGVYRLRKLRPDAERPYKVVGYPVLPAIYLVSASVILVVLLVYRPATTLPGFAIVGLGVPVYLILARRKGTADSKDS